MPGPYFWIRLLQRAPLRPSFGGFDPRRRRHRTSPSTASDTSDSRARAVTTTAPRPVKTRTATETSKNTDVAADTALVKLPALSHSRFSNASRYV